MQHCGGREGGTEGRREGRSCKVQMKEDCHSELSWERKAGMRVRQAGFVFLPFSFFFSSVGRSRSSRRRPLRSRQALRASWTSGHRVESPVSPCSAAAPEASASSFSKSNFVFGVSDDMRRRSYTGESSLGSVRLVLLCFYSTSIMFILQRGPGCKINWYEKT